jgi:hypothetical protein
MMAATWDCVVGPGLMPIILEVPAVLALKVPLFLFLVPKVIFDDRVYKHTSFQPGVPGAGLGGSSFHARMDNCFDDRSSYPHRGSDALTLVLVLPAFVPEEWTIGFHNHPSSQCRGSGTSLGVPRLHPRMNDHLLDRPSS